jgi:hypothetical protein
METTILLVLKRQHALRERAQAAQRPVCPNRRRTAALHERWMVVSSAHGPLPLEETL